MLILKCWGISSLHTSRVSCCCCCCVYLSSYIIYKGGCLYIIDTHPSLSSARNCTSEFPPLSLVCVSSQKGGPRRGGYIIRKRRAPADVDQQRVYRVGRERGRGVLAAAAAAWRGPISRREASKGKQAQHKSLGRGERSFCPLDCRTRFGH